MRTTLVIHDGLMREAKRAAAETGQTLSAVFENALRIALARRPPSSGRRPRLPVSRHSGGARPGVDLDDGSALLSTMEEGRPATARR